MPNENFVVFAWGRGKCFCYMLAGELQDVANRCSPLLDSGFEAYVYKLIADGHPKDGFDPTGATRLQRVYHLHNCDERYADMAHSLIEGLSAHSAWSSVKYIDIVVEKLQEERNNLINDYKLEPKPLAHIADSHTYHTEPDAVPEQTPADEGQTGS